MLSVSKLAFRQLSVQIDMYNGAVYLWQTVRRELAAAIELTGGGGQAGGGGSIWRMFWSAQQRFFKLLCVSLKTPTVVEASQKALADGCCVVIGLQSTGVPAAAVCFDYSHTLVLEAPAVTHPNYLSAGDTKLKTTRFMLPLIFVQEKQLWMR